METALRNRDFPRAKWIAILVPVLLLLMLFGNFRIAGKQYRNVISSDGRGYYHYFIEHFIADEHRDFVAESKYLNDRDGVKHNKYPIGTAVLLTPFFVVGHLTAWCFGFAPDGYSFPYQLLMGIGSLFYLVWGAVMFFKLMRTYHVSDSIAYMVVLVVVFGTNLLFYAVIGSTMSHVYSFALISTFALAVRRCILHLRADYLFLAIVSFGLIVLVRPFNGLIVLALPFLLADLPDQFRRVKLLLSNKPVIISGVLVVLFLGALQLISWHIQTGRILLDSYTNEGFYFRNPQIINVLFSFNKGLFVYAPVIFVALCSALIWLRRQAVLTITYFGFFAIITYFISAWWCWNYASGFGLRPFIDYYALLGIPLAVMLQRTAPFLKRIGQVLLMVLVAFNLLMSYQYTKGIMHPSSMNFEKFKYIFLKTSDEYIGSLGGYFDVAPYAPNGLRMIVDKQLIPEGDVHVIREEFEMTVDIASENLTSETGKLFWQIRLEKREYEPGSAINPLMVIDMDRGSAVPYYDAFKINDIAEYPAGEWVAHEYKVTSPSASNSSGAKLYIWNRGMGEFEVRNFRVEIYKPEL